MKIKKFYEPIMTADVIFITDSTPVAIEKWMKRKYNRIAEGYDSLAGSVTLLDETDKKGRRTREYLIIVEGKKDFYTLLHETVHLTQHILRDRMISVREDNDEVFAHYQTYWFKQLWRFMNNKEVVLKKK